MKKFLYLLTICSIFIVALVGCTSGVPQDEYDEIISENAKLSSEIAELESRNEEKIPIDTSIDDKSEQSIDFSAIHKDNDISTYDFETAYNLCVQFITEFQYARVNDKDIDFTEYMVNEKLINHMQQSLIAHPYVQSLPNTKEVNITGLIDYELQNNERMYIKICFGYKEGNSIGSRVAEFIVENIKGRLEISECYIGGKDTIDTICRGRLDVKNDEIYWNDYDEVELQTAIDAHLSKFENL